MSGLDPDYESVQEDMWHDDHESLAALPTGWRKFPTGKLESLLDELDDSTRAYDEVSHELDLREATEADDRIAQAFGCERNPQPS